MVQQEVTNGAGDKIVKCLAVIGVIATAKTMWNPLKNYVLGKKKVEGERKDTEEEKEAAVGQDAKPKS